MRATMVLFHVGVPETSGVDIFYFGFYGENKLSQEGFRLSRLETWGRGSEFSFLPIFLTAAICAGSCCFFFFLIDWMVCRGSLWLIFPSSTNGSTIFWKYSLFWQLIFLKSTIDIHLITFVPLHLCTYHFWHLLFCFAAWCLYYHTLFNPLGFNKRERTPFQVIQTLVLESQYSSQYVWELERLYRKT